MDGETDEETHLNMTAFNVLHDKNEICQHTIEHGLTYAYGITPISV